MAYTPTVWKNREVERPRTFQEQNNPDGTVTLIPKEGNVIEAGTPIIADTMNKIEIGIKEAHDGLGEIGDVSQVLETHLVDYVKHPAYGITKSFATQTYAVDIEPSPTIYTEGMGIVLRLSANSSATESAFLNINGLGAKALRKANGNTLNSLKLGGVYSFRYSPLGNAGNGAFILQGEGGEYGNVTPGAVISGYTFGTDEGLKTGTMPNHSGIFTTKYITTQNGIVSIPQGYHDGSGRVQATYVAGKQSYEGTSKAVNNNTYVDVVGLPWQPDIIIGKSQDSAESMTYCAIPGLGINTVNVSNVTATGFRLNTPSSANRTIKWIAIKY